MGSDSGAGCAEADFAPQLGQAVRLLQTGQPEAAESLCNRIIERAPLHSDALHVLGVAALTRGDSRRGAELIGRSLQINPGQPHVLCSLGNALRGLGQPAAALVHYRQALQIAPHFAGALYCAGNALLDLGEMDQALASYERALAVAPDYAACHVAREKVLMDRANSRLRLRQYATALADYDALLRTAPPRAETCCNRAHCLLELGDFPAALAGFEAALRLDPDLAVAVEGCGMALRALGRYPEALVALNRARTLAPASADVLYRRALTLRDLQRHEDAANVFQEVIRISPQYPYALGNLLHEQLLSCDWAQYTALLAQLARDLQAGTPVCPPGAFLSLIDSPAGQLQCARRYVTDKHPPPSPPPALPRYRHGRIRLAYVSGDLRQHPVSQLLAGVFEQHDRDRFDTVAVSLSADDGTALARRVRQAFGRFIDAEHRSDRDLAALLRELEIDIAIDLTGLSGRGRPALFGLRPAPLQVNFLGYPGTLGTGYHDYIIADRIVIPEEDRRFYSEKVAYLPHCFQPNDDSRGIAAARPTRQQCGLPDRGFVFCCFNRYYKLNPAMFDVWMRLLSRIDGSVLWLSPGDATAVQNLRREALARGVDPGRLVFSDWLPDPGDHLARYGLADLFLDTLPFNAHTTASDALWAGLPVLTCQGRSYAARVSASLLTTLGCPELIAHDLEQYEALAGELAMRPERTAVLRERVIRNRTATALFDTGRYTRDLESLYTALWERHERGAAPAHFGSP